MSFSSSFRLEVKTPGSLVPGESGIPGWSTASFPLCAHVAFPGACVWRDSAVSLSPPTVSVVLISSSPSYLRTLSQTSGLKHGGSTSWPMESLLQIQPVVSVSPLLSSGQLRRGADEAGAGAGMLGISDVLPRNIPLRGARDRRGRPLHCESWPAPHSIPVCLVSRLHVRC